MTDYQKMRQGVGLLLAELMRIKAEGDYAAIKTLVDAYGISTRCCGTRSSPGSKRSDLPTYWAGVNPQMTAQLDAKGAVTSVRVNIPASVGRLPVLMLPGLLRYPFSRVAARPRRVNLGEPRG